MTLVHSLTTSRSGQFFDVTRVVDPCGSIPLFPPAQSFLPCSEFSFRYAITVWYFDADERARAKVKYLTGKHHWGQGAGAAKAAPRFCPTLSSRV